MTPRSQFATASSVQFSLEQSAHVRLVVDSLRQKIAYHGGWIPFCDFMRFVLYEPTLGYYAGPAQKFGVAGDFVTAPNLTPLFGTTIARSIAVPLNTKYRRILELGAGNGDLAHAVLSALSARGLFIEYEILEVSGQLRRRQEERLAAFAPQVRWLNALPDTITGVVLANEVLDAVPCEQVLFTEGQYRRIGVTAGEQEFALKSKAIASNPDDPLYRAAQRVPTLEGYRTEVNLEAEALVRTVTGRMRNAVALWFDYGFPRAEYYHAQRREGTLMCHVQHRTHSDVFFAPGLQDITAHVDFTAMAEAARDGGATQLGFVSQANFLLEAGILDELAKLGEPGSAAYLAATNEVNRLLNPAEMGELFKVLVVQCGDGGLPPGFERDQSFRL
jgi:SAM-dependent MidA family methyltransferase